MVYKQQSELISWVRVFQYILVHTIGANAEVVFVDSGHLILRPLIKTKMPLGLPGVLATRPTTRLPRHTPFRRSFSVGEIASQGAGKKTSIHIRTNAVEYVL